jgi:hypothetical protein
MVLVSWGQELNKSNETSSTHAHTHATNTQQQHSQRPLEEPTQVARRALAPAQAAAHDQDQTHDTAARAARSLACNGVERRPGQLLQLAVWNKRDELWRTFRVGLSRGRRRSRLRARQANQLSPHCKRLASPLLRRRRVPFSLADDASPPRPIDCVCVSAWARRARAQEARPRQRRRVHFLISFAAFILCTRAAAALTFCAKQLTGSTFAFGQFACAQRASARTVRPNKRARGAPAPLPPDRAAQAARGSGLDWVLLAAAAAHARP